MASPPSFRLRFLSLQGGELPDGPREWTPAWVDTGAPDDAEPPQLRLQHAEISVVRRRVGQRLLWVGEWPRCGPGHYQLTMERGGEPGGSEVVTIKPRKLSDQAYGVLLKDLEALPCAIALQLQRLGALGGVALRPPDQQTFEQEFLRIRVALHGHQGTSGLLRILPALAHNPHHVLAHAERWVRAQEARAPYAPSLPGAMGLPGNLDDAQRPVRILDVRSAPSVDTPENRMVKSYVGEVSSVLDRLVGRLRRSRSSLYAQAQALQEELRQAVRDAPFLSLVTAAHGAALRPTMVLLRLPEYQAALVGLRRFREHPWPSVDLALPELESPLRNLPSLYEKWCTLQVVSALCEAAQATGSTYQVVEQRLVSAVEAGEWVQVLRANQPALRLRAADGTHVTLTPQRVYDRSGLLRSVSFRQMPDVAVEVHPPAGPARVYIFDPKYKLALEGQEDAAAPLPKKEDIDKMHTYRDALRDHADHRVVAFAAILYPGADQLYGADLAALRAMPGDTAGLAAHLDGLLRRALAETNP